MGMLFIQQQSQAVKGEIDEGGELTFPQLTQSLHPSVPK